MCFVTGGGRAGVFGFRKSSMAEAAEWARCTKDLRLCYVSFPYYI